MKLTVADTQQCNDCDCSSEAIAQAGGCPMRAPRGVHQAQAFATTEPGELAPLREHRKPRGAGVALAVVLVLCAACIALAIAAALQGVPQ